MTRMERFEKIWADQHAVPPESLLQYRWVTQEGYRLPAMAAHFRTFCETLDSIVIELPAENPLGSGPGDCEGGMPSFEQHCAAECNFILRDCRDAIIAAGLKVAS